MPASTYATLYDIAGPVEDAVQTVLAARSTPITAFTQRETNNLPQSRVDLQFTLGAMLDYGVTNDSANKLAPAAWEASLRVEVRTKRGGALDHAATVAAIHDVFRPAGEAAINDALTYHTVTRFLLIGQEPQTVGEDDVDLTTLNFSLLVCIRRNAWPA